MAVDWNYFDRYNSITDRFMPARGEGETVASQIVTAVNKLIYKWYNDGDVYDNTHYLPGWANDLSSYANWLASHAEGADSILRKIENVKTEEEYEDLIKELSDLCLDCGYLDKYAIPKDGSIYDCKGPYKYEAKDDDTEWY